MNNNFSDYIVYVDESGDHGLNNINKNYPVFVLVFCIFKKSEYLKAVSEIQNCKFNHFGHDMVILHESEIRRGRGDFSAFNKTDKENFISELTNIIAEQDLTIVAAIIDKLKLNSQYNVPNNPYHLAMGFCLERLYNFLDDAGDATKTTYVIFEKRGKTEDKELELEFRRWCDGDNFFKEKVNFQINTVDKKANSAGLQLADLIARPIGLSYLRPKQENKAFDIIKQKFRTYKGHYKRAGLKVFPDS